ncbi:MAG TPA: serine/threonine-protein kinase [Candidatus Obscuribacter sp.]|nr:serine/threonine-protein kinase [Candidatus Obscuribacter sp.]HND68502.1 serine/threonine-protein kinase [Candidatus Obscuribacter sp.]HNG75614.1 serine/threonine-protein kinase [Candidatus Obscuribacter sp.]
MPLQDSFSRKSDKPDQAQVRSPRPAKWPRVPTVEDLEFSFQRAKDSPGIPAAMSWKRTESSNFVLSVTWETGGKGGEATWLLMAEEMGDNVVLWSFRSRDAGVIHKLMEEAIQALDPTNQPEDENAAQVQTVVKPGTQIDHYEIVEEIGCGGMGVVYRGKDNMFERTVAIKVLHTKLLSDPLSKKRFEQEGRATIALAHPNLISVYHYGFSSAGLPFIVMEYVDGKGLDKTLEQVGHLEFGEFIEIFLQACDALGHAHERGIIHRDLKPSNLMLVNLGKKERLVKIVDFGISKILPHGRFPGQDLTNAGDVVGSPLYMSPEQCKGLSLDGRSDIYSLGCLMYQAITGALPFLGENALQTLSKHICDPPPKFKEIAPDLKIPPELEKIIFRTLEKEPEKRYETVAELHADLEAIAPKSKGLSLTTTTLSKVTSTATAGSVHILVETDTLPRSTLEAAVQIQKMLREGTITLAEAASAINRAHVTGGEIDIQKLASPREHTSSLVVDTPLEAVLVEAGLISNAVWRTLLQLQAAIRSGEMTKDEAVQEFRKRHPKAPPKEAKPPEPEKAPIVVPTNPVDMLKQAGIITQADLDAAKKQAAEKGTKLEKVLVSMGKIDTKTVLASYQCMTLLSTKKLKLEQAVIALNFCERMRVDFSEAVQELGWNI